MLKNILIKTGFATEIAVQGKFINVVLATGEINARIRLDSGQIFETKLVSGMGFEVAEGFKSVSFESDTTQQTKIWMGNIPLSYTPIESKIVGSSTLVSQKYSVGYGDAKQLVAERIGRKNITFSASKDFYIGSSSVSALTAIRVPANTNFTMETQASVWAYSADAADKVKVIADLTKGLQAEKIMFTGDAGLSKGFISYLEALQKYAVVSGGYLTLYSLNDTSYTSYTTAVTSTKTFGRFSNGDIATINGSNLAVISQVDGTLRNNAIVASGMNHIAINSINDDIAVFEYSAMTLYAGNETAGLTARSHPLTGTADTYMRGAIYTLTNNLIIFSDNYYAISTDNGVTWGAALSLPAQYGATNGYSFALNELNGDIYYGDVSGNLYRSQNDGVSFNIIKSPALGADGFPMLDSVFAAGDTIVISNGTGYCYTTDGGLTWIDTIFSTYHQAQGGALVTNDGVFLNYYNNITGFMANSTVVVGGMSVAALEQIN